MGMSCDPRGSESPAMIAGGIETLAGAESCEDIGEILICGRIL